MEKNELEKEAIVAEYLNSELTYRQLGEKHNVHFGKIHYWVRIFQGKIKLKLKLPTNKLKAKVEAQKLPEDVKTLQAELRKTRLHNELLEEMLSLSEDLTGVELRKKFGARQF